MTTTSSAMEQPRSSAITGEAADKRLFDLLEGASQERVVMLKTRYEQLMALERAAFLQELGLVATRDMEEEAARRAVHGKLSLYHSDRLAAVQARENGYVMLAQNPVAAPDEPPFQDAEDKAAEEAVRKATVGMAMSDLTLRRMLTDSIYGEAPVKARQERRSLYEKIGALEGEEEEAEKEKRASDARSEEAALRRKSTMAPKAVGTVGEPGKLLYRSNAYQALRLAHSFPSRINVNQQQPGAGSSTTTTEDPALANATVNVTGIPIYEDELRVWFDAMDKTQSGYLDCDEFMAFMRSLDRDFGVADAYTTLERDGQRLALGGKLGFEAFAYLVMRFARE